MAQYTSLSDKFPAADDPRANQWDPPNQTPRRRPWASEKLQLEPDNISVDYFVVPHKLPKHRQINETYNNVARCEEPKITVSSNVCCQIWPGFWRNDGGVLAPANWTRGGPFCVYRKRNCQDLKTNFDRSLTTLVISAAGPPTWLIAATFD